MARGAVEVGRRHYPLVVAVHAAWLISLWVLGRDQPVNIAALPFYLVLQGLRFWVMWTLGRRRTTRIIGLPAPALVSVGPYPVFSPPHYGLLPRGRAVCPFSLH